MPATIALAVVGGGPMGFGLLVDHAELAEMGGGWRALERRTAPHVFQSHAFVQGWFSAVSGDARTRPAVVTWTPDGDGGDPLGLFPACRAGVCGVGFVSWAGGAAVTDYGDVLFDPEGSAGLTPDGFVSGALEELRRAYPRDCVYLPNVRHDAIAYPELARQMRAHRREFAPCVRMAADIDSFMTTLSTDKRHEVRRRLRRLAELGEVRFRTLGPGDPELDLVLDPLIEHKKRRYSARGARSVLHDPRYERFYRQQAHEHPAARVSCLSVDGDPIAFDLSYLHSDRLYVVLNSFDERYASYSPGKVHIYHLIALCHEQGVGVLDFCLGGERYKMEWTKEGVAETSFIADGPAGRAFSAAAAIRRGITGIARPRPRRSGAPSSPSR